MKVLLSGFEPFGGNQVNPTELLMKEVVAAPEAFRHEGLSELRAVVLPVTFAEAFERLSGEIQSFKPDVVLAFGLAAGRGSAIEIERVAINCIDCDIPDNAGRVFHDEPVLPDGPNALFSTLPARTLVADLEAAGVSARISNTAGTYVCNFLFYRLQELNLDSNVRSGFIHVPFLSEHLDPKSANAPSISFEMMKLALKTMLKTVLSTLVQSQR